MRAVSLALGGLVVVAATGLPAAAGAQTNATLLHFAVTRNGEPIGSSTIRLQRDGDKTIARSATHIAVKILDWTVYRFDQTETEDLSDGRLQAMNTVTDDNGTVHRVAARRSGDVISVDADGRITEVPPNLIPASPWNASLIHERVALNPQDGSITPVAVVDHGEEQLVLQGRPTTAHHYSIRTSFPQDVWYDQQRRLVKVEMHGSDGSMIQYRLA
jgi:Domain of unknown function (DUF6134)